MRKIYFLFIVTAAVAITSCSDSKVKSLQPFYTDNTLVMKPHIEGDWLVYYGDTSSIMRISKFTYRRDSSTIINAYKISVLDVKRKIQTSNTLPSNPFQKINGKYYLSRKENKSSTKHPSSLDKNNKDTTTLLAHLIKLKNGAYYFDLTKFSDSNSENYSIHIHQIAKLSIQKNIIIMQNPNDRFFTESIKNNKVKIPRQNLKSVSTSGKVDSSVLITAEPKKLQKFLLKYDAKLFDKNATPIPLKRIIVSK